MDSRFRGDGWVGRIGGKDGRAGVTEGGDDGRRG